MENYFHDGEVLIDGQSYRFAASDARTIESTANYWHGPSDPSTWLAVAVALEAQRRVGDGRDAAALDLAAQVLGITVDRLRGLITSHEEYMRWHDGDPDYTVF